MNMTDSRNMNMTDSRKKQHEHDGFSYKTNE